MEALDQTLTVENLEQPDLQLSRTLDLEFNCKDGTTVWSEVTLSLIRDKHGVPMGLLGVARDVTERKRAEEALNNRLQFEHILSKISADLINSSYEGMDKIINEALKGVSQFTGAVRSSIFLYSDNLTKVTNTHEWCADPKDSQISLLQGIPADKFGYYFELLKKLETVVIGNPDDLPTEAHGEREWIKEFGFRPLLFVPMIHEGSLYGTVGFYGKLDEERDWPQEAIGQLKILADLFVTTMERKQVEEALFESEAKYRNLIEGSYDLVQSIKPDGSFIFVNKAWRETLGYDENEIDGIKLLDILPPESQAYCKDLFLKVIAGESQKNIETTFFSKYGRKI